MRNFYCVLLVLFLGIWNMAFSQTGYVSLSFTRSGADASSVAVNVSGVSGVSATMNECSHTWKTGDKIGTSILCPNVNATQSPTITMTFTLTGLPEGTSFSKVGLDIHALNGSSAYQQNNDSKIRQWNIAVEQGASLSTLNSYSSLNDVDIADGVGVTDNVHQIWELAGAENITASSTLTLKLTITQGTTNHGCFFGLSEIRLYQIANPEEVTAALSEAESLLALNGVGYPSGTSEARIALRTAFEATKNQSATVSELSTLTAAIAAYKSCTDILMPEDGKAYRIISLQPVNDLYFYMNENGLQLSTTERTSNDAIFICRKVGEKYAFVNAETNNYLVNKSDKGGYNSNSGHTDTYLESACTFKIYSGNAAVDHEKAFGSVAIVGNTTGTGNKFSAFTITPDGAWNKYSRNENETPVMQINGTCSTVERLIEVPVPSVTPPTPENGLAEILAANNGLVYLYSTVVDRQRFLMKQEGSGVKGGFYDATKTAQIWQIQPSGSGYTIRNMSSGKFLEGPDDAKNVGLKSTSTVYYITSSEAEGYTDHYVISNTSDFANGSCISSAGETIEAWDKGVSQAAWDIVAATNANYEELLGALTGSIHYYKVRSKLYNHLITESWDEKNMKGVADGDLATQYWKFTESAGKWTIQSVSSKLYVQGDMGQGQEFKLGTEEQYYTLQELVDGEVTHYGIRHESVGGRGFHESSSQGNRVVSWDHTVDASRWILEEVNLTEQQIAAFEEEYYNSYGAFVSDEASEAFLNLFTDASTGELKSQYQSMSDAELRAAMAGLHVDLQNIAIKVKNNAWSNDWDKSFRVAKYGAFSDANYWARQLKTQAYGEINNPTGIVANSGENVYIIVGDDIPAGATLQAHTRCRANVADCSGSDHHSRQTITLKKGINVLICSLNASHVYINYLSQNGTEIANWPELNIHVEGGRLQGYVDIKKHSDADWADMKSCGLFQADNMVNLLGNYAQLHINTTAAIKNGDNIIPLIEIYDWYVHTELDLMGLTAAPAELKDLPGAEAYEDIYPKKVNNRMLCIGLSNNVLHGGSGHICLGTDDSFNYESIKNRGANVWGATHEYGHVNQGAINMIACTERSNNLFANVAIHKGGTCTSRGVNLSKMQEYMAAGTHSWMSVLGGDTFHAAQLYYQLYLYYHAAGNNPFFYQTLFSLLRQDPMNPTTAANGVCNGTQDYLKFALKACEAAGEDLTEFFEYWGFFEPVENKSMGEYGVNYTLTTTQEQIDGVKADMAKYAKKGNAGMIFIEDRAVPSYKSNGIQKDAFGEYTVDYCAAKLEGAQYSSFNGNKTYPNRMGYTLTGNYFTVNNTSGASGFKFYNADGKLVYVASDDYFEIPYSVFQYIDLSKTVATLTDGTTMPLYNTAENLYLLRVCDDAGECYERFAGENEAALISEERDGENATAQLLSKDGGAPFDVPVALSEVDNVSVNNAFHCLNLTDKKNIHVAEGSYIANNIVYTRKNTAGYNSVCLPFNLKLQDLPEGSKIEVLDRSETKDGVTTIYFNDGVQEVAAGTPCLVWCPENETEWNIVIDETRSVVAQPVESASEDRSFVMKGSFVNDVIGEGKYKLMQDGTEFGKTTVEGKITAFRIWVETEGAFNAARLKVQHNGVLTDIELPVETLDDNVVYDLWGRRVCSPQKNVIYILNGKRIILK